MNDDVKVYERDVWIVSYLQQAPDDQRTIRDIWEAARAPRFSETADDVVQLGGLGETASLPTYHRSVGKLVARGLLDVEGENGEAARYKVARQISALTAVSQTELNEALWELGPVKALAMYVDVVEHFEASAKSTLRRAAEGLMLEEPRELILCMLKDVARELDEDIADLRDPESAESDHQRLVTRRLADFGRFVHGELGINPSVWRVPTIDEIEAHGASLDVSSVEKLVTPRDWQAVATEMGQHVFGRTFIEYVDVPAQPPGGRDLVVAGSDGSSHVGAVRGMPAAAYTDAERLLLTFNNSAGYVDVPSSFPTRYPSPYHGVPVTRAALEDPNNKGMIIARPWYHELEDGEFEHMKKAALDVVQFRIDEALMSGSALPYGSHPVKGGAALPRPNVLIRDGTVTPQARELQNYTNPTVYGDIVQEGIRISYRVLREVMDSERRVYAGAVKSTQLRTFSRIVNWYIKRGSAERFGTPIDSEWDVARMSVISDAVAMTRLLSALPELSRRSQYYRTCTIVRPFPAMVTSLFRVNSVVQPHDWVQVFETKVEHARREYARHGGVRPFFDRHDVEEDDYVRMCIYADYGMFYFGKPGGDPQVAFPRFEFLDSIRTISTEDDRSRRVLKNVDFIMGGVHKTKWAQDYEHNMLTNRKMPKLVPFVVYEAHEKCKVLGHKLALELQQSIAEKLSQLKGRRGLPVPKIDVEPVSADWFERYLQKMKSKLLGRGETLGDAPPTAVDLGTEESASGLLGSGEQADDMTTDGLG